MVTIISIGTEHLNLLFYIPMIFRDFLDQKTMALKSLVNLSIMVQLSHHSFIDETTIRQFQVGNINICWGFLFVVIIYGFRMPLKIIIDNFLQPMALTIHQNRIGPYI